MRPTWTIATTLDRSIQALGCEIDRLAELAEQHRPCPMCQNTQGLTSKQAHQLATMVRSVCSLAEEEREARKHADGRGSLAEQIAKAIVDDPTLRGEVAKLIKQLERGAS